MKQHHQQEHCHTKDIGKYGQLDVWNHRVSRYLSVHDKKGVCEDEVESNQSVQIPTFVASFLHEVKLRFIWKVLTQLICGGRGWEALFVGGF